MELMDFIGYILNNEDSGSAEEYEDDEDESEEIERIEED